MADQLMLDAELAAGNVSSTKNRHGYGAALREKYGILTASHLSNVQSHEKTGFSAEQLDSLARGVTPETRHRYKKEG